MREQIKNLAAAMRVAPPGKKFVLMLGAGASLSSGVKLTQTIMEELVREFAAGNTQDSIEDRFDALWEQSAPEARERMMKPYLQAKPSNGFVLLADLIRRGFVDTIVTFNFDCVLESVLRTEGIEFRTIIRGEVDLDAIATLMRQDEPRVKVLKLHGSLRSAEYFLFSKVEMLQYPDQIRAVLHELTGRDIIVCGYAFNDLCVVDAFNRQPTSGAIYCVNPSGVPNNLKGFMGVRRSYGRVIRDELGKFDAFMTALHADLTEAKPPAVQRAEPRQNLFKFLDHYHLEHKQWFWGRRRQVFEVRRGIEDAKTRLLYLTGEAKVGKTSLVCAGVLPHLNEKAVGDERTPEFATLYVRCTSNLEQALASQLEARGLPRGPQGIGAGLQALKAKATKRAVVVLDQFEKITRTWAAEDAARSAGLVATVQALAKAADERLCLLIVGTSETDFWKFLVEHHLTEDHKSIKVEALSPRMVNNIIRHAARRGAVSIDARLVQRLVSEYQDSLTTRDSRRDRPPFTLTHVQAFCYCYVRSAVPVTDQDPIRPALLAALERARNNTSLVDLLDDLPAEQRSLFRCLLRVICDPRNSNTRTIVEFMRDRFPEIRLDTYPEPIQ